MQWHWQTFGVRAKPLGVGAPERTGSTTGNGQGLECFGFSLGTAFEVVATLGTASYYRQTGEPAVLPSDSLFISVQAVVRCIA